jgi:uncharacterized protein (DUF4415 family)
MSEKVIDRDNPEWTVAEFARARPASEVHGQAVAAMLKRGRGRPPMPPEKRKRQVTVRLSPEILAAARATGPGWQARVNEALRKAFLGKGRSSPAKKRA